MQRAETPPTRFAVVSWSGDVPIHLSPRGQRTEHLINALARYGQVERVGGDNIPQWLAGDSKRTTSSWYRRLARSLVYSALIDKHEIAARRSLRRWSPAVDAAVLVGYPCSPLPFAAHQLARSRIPYLVDIGDPWMLTNPHPEGRRLRRSRAARWERKLWASARGVIVTTHGQGEALRRLFPHLRVLVRPNGYNPPETKAAPPANMPAAGVGNELRLVHYGSLYGARVDLGRIFQQLARSGKWDKITLRQYGPDWEGALQSISDSVGVDHRAPISWAEVLSEAHTFHAAVVIGWQNAERMPSKTVQYLTLPIPRIAMVNAGKADALAAYVIDKPGWAVVEDDSHDASEIVAAHLAKTWTSADLRAPECESWDAVEHVLGDFAAGVLAMQS
jgi:glycosyltransferase involved in cell wall biosynthesis